MAGKLPNEADIDDIDSEQNSDEYSIEYSNNEYNYDTDTSAEQGNYTEELVTNFRNKVNISSTKPKATGVSNKSAGTGTSVSKVKKDDRKMTISLPTIVYPYFDSGGQQHVSVDVLHLSWMETTGIIPKIRPCGKILDFLIEIPHAFFQADRLALGAAYVKRASLVENANKLLANYGQSEDQFRVRVTHSVPLLFQVQDFSKNYIDAGYETIRMEAGNLSNAAVCSDDIR